MNGLLNEMLSNWFRNLIKTEREKKYSDTLNVGTTKADLFHHSIERTCEELLS